MPAIRDPLALAQHAYEQVATIPEARVCSSAALARLSSTSSLTLYVDEKTKKSRCNSRLKGFIQKGLAPSGQVHVSHDFYAAFASLPRSYFEPTARPHACVKRWSCEA